MDQVDREIAVLLREKEAAEVTPNEGLERAMNRLREKQTFSALEAADRELQRAREDEELLLIAMAL